jgi:hypothetical protein
MTAGGPDHQGPTVIGDAQLNPWEAQAELIIIQIGGITWLALREGQGLATVSLTSGARIQQGVVAFTFRFYWFAIGVLDSQLLPFGQDRNGQEVARRRDPVFGERLGWDLGQFLNQDLPIGHLDDVAILVEDDLGDDIFHPVEVDLEELVTDTLGKDTLIPTMIRIVMAANSGLGRLLMNRAGEVIQV